jgi:hypothetical protein
MDPAKFCFYSSEQRVLFGFTEVSKTVVRRGNLGKHGSVRQKLIYRYPLERAPKIEDGF